MRFIPLATGPAAVILAFAVLRILHRRTYQEVLARRNVHTLKRKYDRLRKIEMVLSFTVYLPLMVGFTVLWAFLLQWAADAYGMSWEGTVHAVGTSSAYWAVVGLPLSLLTVSAILYPAWRLSLGKERFEEWMDYGVIVMQMDVMGPMRFLLIACAVLVALTVPLGMGSYVRATDEAFVTNAYFGIGETLHSYESIEKVWDEGDNFIMLFRDGTRWYYQGGLRVDDPDELQKVRDLIEHVADGAGLEVIRE